MVNQEELFEVGGGGGEEDEADDLRVVPEGRSTSMGLIYRSKSEDNNHHVQLIRTKNI